MINKLTNKIKREIRKTNNNEFTNFIMNLDNSSNTNYSLWKSIKKLKSLPNSPIQKLGGNWTTIENQAEIMVEYLSETFTNKPHIPPNNSNNETLKYKAIRKEEIFTIIKQLKINKIPGYDLIIAKMLKKVPAKAIRFLTILINAIYRVGNFPLEVCRNHTSTKRQKPQIPIIL